MKQRALWKNGPMVGEIGFGAMSFCDFFGKTDTATSHRTLDKALELGVTHLDTALVYGPHVSEIAIGDYFVKNPAAKKRFSIATKGGIQPSPRKVDNSAAFMRACLESSLMRLNVDSVDLYYVHRRDHSIPIEDVVGTLARFKDEGKIRGIGLSEISPATLQRAAAVHPIAAVQSEYSLWTRLPELGLLQACKRLGASFVAFSPLARGFLSDRGLDPATLEDGDFRRKIPRFTTPHYDYNLQLVEPFRAFARARGWSTEALALAWVLKQHEHIIPIPGTRTPENLVKDVGACDIHLSADDLAEIDVLLPAGWAHGNRYSLDQQGSSEHYC
jgi:aryl-alcohol dehydrogenase-like predicted oxidoreductase